MTRRRATGLALLPLAALALLAPAPGPAAAAPVPAPAAAPQARAAAPAVLRAGAPLRTPSVVPDRPVSTSAATARIDVSYSGFSPAARAAFERAVEVWERSVVSSVPITVRAVYEPLGPGVLGSAGPSFLWRDFPGADRRNTWYVDALANEMAGRQLDRRPDVVARFSSSFDNWHFGSGPAPAGRYDFPTVVAHELGHGLGFLGAGAVRDGRGSVRLQGLPTAYDHHTEDGAGRALLSFADPSAALARELTGGSVFFDSPAVRSANGGRPAELYAPGTWDPGSSYSHLDERTYRPGTADSLMTPRLSSGETVRTPGPVAQALLRTLGW